MFNAVHVIVTVLLQHMRVCNISAKQKHPFIHPCSRKHAELPKNVLASADSQLSDDIWYPNYIETLRYTDSLKLSIPISSYHT